jgi:hypothetical protein
MMTGLDTNHHPQSVRVIELAQRNDARNNVNRGRCLVCATGVSDGLSRRRLCNRLARMVFQVFAGFIAAFPLFAITLLRFYLSRPLSKRHGVNTVFALRGYRKKKCRPEGAAFDGKHQ